MDRVWLAQHQSHLAQERNSKRFLFIVGAPHSGACMHHVACVTGAGTSMLRNLLARHADAAVMSCGGIRNDEGQFFQTVRRNIM